MDTMSSDSDSSSMSKDSLYTTTATTTDLKIDLADGCDAVLELLGLQLDNGNCNTIVRVDIGYFHNQHHGPAAAALWNWRREQRGGGGGGGGDRFSSRLSDDELMLVFQGIVCCLPNMKTLVIMSYFRADAMSLPVGALEMIFRRAIRLEILFLHQIKLHGSENEFRVMAQSLDQHPSLKRVNLHCCGTAASAPTTVGRSRDNAGASGETLPQTSLDPLVSALAALPTMYYLSLDQVPISQVAIEALARSQSLKDLSFYNMPEIHSCLHILLNALGQQHNSSCDNKGGISHLRGLRIRSCNLGATEAVLITTMLETNNSLESLVFYVDAWEDYGVPLGAALANNTSLKRLEVGIGKSQYTSAANLVATSTTAATTAGSQGDPIFISSSTSTLGQDREQDEINIQENKHKGAAQAIAKALAVNTATSLHHLCLSLFHAQNHEIYDAYMEPFGVMLESNYSLESLLLQGNNCFSVMNPTVGFLLKLNQRSVLDRRRLFRDVARLQDNENQSIGHNTSYNCDQRTTKDPWVESLVRHRDDLSIINYLLSRNPNLIVSAVV